MRVSSMICAAAAVLTVIGPASAQFGVPFGGPGLLTSPEAISGAIGAGAAHSAREQQQCQQTYAGRDGPRTVCSPSTPGPAPRR